MRSTLIANRTGLEAKTVKNLRSELRAAGLIRVHPEKDEGGKVIRWVIQRTLAPREPGPATSSGFVKNGSTTPCPDQDLRTHISGPGRTTSSPDPDPGFTGSGRDVPSATATTDNGSQGAANLAGVGDGTREPRGLEDEEEALRP
jgi:hypothetical protein